MDDALQRVFQLLSCRDLTRCERVCHRWRRQTAETFRQKATFDAHRDYPGTIGNQEAMTTILDKYGASLRKASFAIPEKTERYAVTASEHHLTSSMMKTLAERATRLTILRMQRLHLTVGAVESLCLLPETLTELSIVNCIFSCRSNESSDVIQQSLVRFLSKCTKLRKFEILSRGFCLDQNNLNLDLFDHLPDSIEHLSIAAGNSLKITNLEFLRGKRLRSLVLQRSFISVADLSILLEMAGTLTILDVTSSINVQSCQLIGHLNNLRELNVSNMRDGMDDISLISIIEGCPKLEKLSLGNCSRLSEVGLRRIGSLSHLRSLSICSLSGVTDRVVREIIRCQRLEWIDMSCCRNVSAAALLDLCCLPSLSHLEVLAVPSFHPRILEQCQRRPATVVSDNYETVLPLLRDMPPLPGYVAA